MAQQLDKFGRSAVFPANSSLSAAVFIGSYKLVAIKFPAVWASAAVTFQTGPKSDSLGVAVAYNTGSPLSIMGAADQTSLIPPDFQDSLGPWLKLSSGPVGGAVKQTTGGTALLVLLPRY